MVWRVNELATVVWNLGTSGYSDVKCQIYDETFTPVGSPANMVEIGTTGIYYHTFTPDNDGVWMAHVYKGTDEDTFLYVVGWGVEGRGIGSIFVGKCDSGMSGSTTTIVCEDLAGFGDDYFNTDYRMYVVLNDNAHGSAPEGEYRDITDYVSVTGTFTTAAFTVNVEALDAILIVHSTVDITSLQVPSADSTANTLMRDVLGNKADTLAAAINATSSLMRYMKGALGSGWTNESLKAIKDAIDALSQLIGASSDGQLTADGTEQTIYEEAAPSAYWEPRAVIISFDQMLAGDTTIIKEWVKVRSASSYEILDQKTYQDADGGLAPRTVDVIGPPPHALRYAYKVTLQQTGGTNRTYDWQAVRKT